MTEQNLAWNYSALAAHYEQRAPYHGDVIAVLREHGLIHFPCRAVDFGAGTGRFTRMLQRAGCSDVDALEPNDAMREIGERLTAGVRWHRCCAESSSLAANSFGLASFASSFNVVDVPAALSEAARLLVGGGALVLLYNHRDLEDPLQLEIESCIRRHLPNYQPGARREDPLPQVLDHGAFCNMQAFALPLKHRILGAEFVAGFRAHATLIRQAGEHLNAVLTDIEKCVPLNTIIEVPFVTRFWLAKRRAR
jgi:SAM-dependent methyltransferase